MDILHNTYRCLPSWKIKMFASSSIATQNAAQELWWFPPSEVILSIKSLLRIKRDRVQYAVDVLKVQEVNPIKLSGVTQSIEVTHRILLLLD